MTPSSNTQADQLGELGQVDLFMAVCGKSFIVDLDVAKTPEGSQMLSVEWPKELFYYALLKRGPRNGVLKAGWESFDCVEIERNIYELLRWPVVWKLLMSVQESRCFDVVFWLHTKFLSHQRSCLHFLPRMSHSQVVQYTSCIRVIALVEERFKASGMMCCYRTYLQVSLKVSKVDSPVYCTS